MYRKAKSSRSTKTDESDARFIAEVTAETVVAEIGNIKNFANPTKLLAFVWCEPTVYQSGKCLLTRNSMVKKGSNYLRKRDLSGDQSRLHL